MANITRFLKRHESARARGDPSAYAAIEQASARFAEEPHVVAALIDALGYSESEEARRIARDALTHRSFIARRAAARLLGEMQEHS